MKNKTFIFSLLFLSMIIYVGSTALNMQVSSQEISNQQTKESVQMFDVGEGTHSFKFQIGRDTPNKYLGAKRLRQALETGQAQSLAMASDDFNGDGMADLIVGYAGDARGIISLRLGNIQAIAPQDPEVLKGIGEGRYPAPFMPQANLLALPEVTDFLQIGDFDADGYSDVLAGALHGERLYLLPGDGHGNFKALQQIELSGRLTALQADTEQAGTFTKVAVGLQNSEGALIAIYNKETGSLTGEPKTYPASQDVSALTFGQLDRDGVSDVAAASGNEVLIIHDGNSADSLPEKTSIPFAIKGITAGDFVFDRAHQTELAVSAEDGNICFLAEADSDRRAFTTPEKEQIRAHRIAVRRGLESEESFAALTNKMVRRSSKGHFWNIAKTIATEGIPDSSEVQSALKTERLPGAALDNLLIADAAGNTVQSIENADDLQKIGMTKTAAAMARERVDLEKTPLAVLPLRTSVSVKPGIAILQKGGMEPILSVEAATTYTVDRTDDNASAAAQICSAAANDCSLRGAIIKSNANSGADTILLAAGTTYTLTLGPFDDEFNFGGAVPESGDLDILDSTSITGGNRDTTVIQMGTLVPAQGGISKDRVLETNDFINLQHAYNVTLSNLTIQNGNAPKTPAPDNYNTKGGGIMYDGFESNTNQPSGVLTLTNCKVTNNTAAGQGGGITTIDATLIVQSTSIVSANISTFGAGGGISYNGGNTVAAQNLQINNSTIGGPLATDGNQAIDTTFGSGGGVQANGGAGATISNGAVVQNNVGGATSGSLGGAGMIFSSLDNVALSNTTISNNKSKHNGGGLFCNVTKPAPNSNNPGSLTLTTVTIQNNQADSDNSGAGDGGGIYNLFGNLTLNNTSGGSLSGNSAVNGGGIFTTWIGNSLNASAGLTVTTGTTISTNTAKNNGGGIAISPGAATTFGTISITGATISNNTANSDSSGGGDGGGIFISSGNLNPLSGVTIDSNVANSGTGDGIKQTGGTITGAGTVNLNGGDSIDLTGGTFTSTSGTLNISGNFTNSGATFNNNGGTCNFNGTTAQNIGNSSLITFNNLTDSNTSAALTASNSFNVNGTLNINGANAVFSPVAAAVIGGTGTLTGTGTARVTRTTATADFFSQYTIANKTLTNLTVEYNGAAAQTVSATTYGGLKINNAAGANLASGTTIVNGTLTLTAGVVGVGANTLTLNNGTSLAAGSLTSAANGTVNYNQGSNGQAVLPGNYGNLTFSNFNKDLTNAAIGIAGAFTPGSGTATTTGSTITFNGAAAQTIPVFNYNNLAVSNSAGANLGGSVTVGGALTLTSGNLGVGTNTLTLNGAATATGGTFSSGAGGTVNYNQSSSGQGVLHGSYGNLQFSNFNKTLPAGTINIAGTFSPGTATGHTITGSTINFNGAGAQTIPAFNYNNLTSSNAGARTLASSGTIGIAGTFTPGANSYTVTGSTIDFNGATAQTIPAFTFNNLSTSASGTKTLGGAAAANGNLTIGSGTTLDASVSNFALSVVGNWTNNGAFTQRAGTVTFNGSAAQTVGGSVSTAFNNLTLNNAAGIGLSIDAAVGGALNLTNGIFSTAANTLTILPTGTTSRSGSCAITTCFVTSSGAGGLKKQFNAATASFVFTVGTTGGTDNGYTPVSLANVTPVGTGDLTVQAVDAASPAAIMTPKISRYWALTGANLTADISFTYLDGDITGTDETKLRVYKETANQCGGDCVVDATNTGTVTNVSSFSNWTIAELLAPTAASTALSGRVTSPLGRGLSRVRVTLSGGNLSEPRYTQTNTFGYYRFAELPVGQTYILSVQSKQYQFSQPTRVINLMEEIDNIDFTGVPYARGDNVK